MNKRMPLTSTLIENGLATLCIELVNKIKSYIDITEHYDYQAKIMAILGNKTFLQFVTSFEFSKEQIIRIRKAEQEKVIKWSQQTTYNPMQKPDINTVFEARYNKDYNLASTLLLIRTSDGFCDKYSSHKVFYGELSPSYSLLTNVYELYMEQTMRPWLGYCTMRQFQIAAYNFVATIKVYGSDNLRKMSKNNKEKV
jgi:hypothetical protein